MKTIGKSVVSCLLMGCMLTSATAFAADSESQQIASESAPSDFTVLDTSVQLLDDAVIDQPNVVFSDSVSADAEDWTITVLDEESYADSLIEKQGMSPSEAAIEASETFSSLASENATARAAKKVVTTVSRTYYPSGCKTYGMGIEYGFYSYMSSGNTPVFEEVWSPWSIAAGTGPHTYVKGSVSAKISSGKVNFNANGNLEVAVSYGTSVSGNISSDTLVSLGFSKSSSSGVTVYYRKYVSYSYTFVGGK